MKLFTLIATTVLVSSAFASSDPVSSVAGSYRLEVSAEVKSMSQKLGMAEPYVRILLRPDGTFSYASNTNGAISGTSGNFYVEDHQVKLVARDHFPAQDVKTLTGRAGDGELIIDGLHYLRAGEPVATAPANRVEPSYNVVGTWNVRSRDRDDKSIRMSFGPDKTFTFVGMSATSKGKYELEGNRLTLFWTEVDGDAVEYGTMRKVIYLSDDGSFRIDSYRYVKS